MKKLFIIISCLILEGFSLKAQDVHDLKIMQTAPKKEVDPAKLTAAQLIMRGLIANETNKKEFIEFRKEKKQLYQIFAKKWVSGLANISDPQTLLIIHLICNEIMLLKGKTFDLKDNTLDKIKDMLSSKEIDKAEDAILSLKDNEFFLKFLKISKLVNDKNQEEWEKESKNEIASFYTECINLCIENITKGIIEDTEPQQPLIKNNQQFI